MTNRDADRVQLLLTEPEHDIRARSEDNLRLTFLGAAARMQGDFERAEALYAEALGNARERKPYEWYFVAIFWGWMALEQGRLDQAETLTREATSVRAPTRSSSRTSGGRASLRLHRLESLRA